MTTVAASRPPRVLIACDWLLKYAAGLAGGLAAAGAAPLLTTRDHGLEFGGDVVEMRAEVRRLAGSTTPVWTVPGRPRQLATVAAVRRLAAARRRLDPDVIHLQSGVENDVRMLWVLGARPRRYAYTVHDPVVHPGERPPGLAGALLAGQLLRRAGLVFVHAEALREELLSHHTVSAPVEVVPHGIEAAVVRPLPQRPSVLFFGRISAYKGLSVLLDAMAAVWAALPATRLVVAGEGDVPDHPALRDTRVELRVGHVPQADVPALFAAATVVALPYMQASQSGVGSLAKGHGRPIVVTRAGGLPELVSDGCGLAVPAADPAAFAGALLGILGDPFRAEAMGRAGATSARNGASWSAVGELTLDAYQRHGLLRVSR